MQTLPIARRLPARCLALIVTASVTCSTYAAAQMQMPACHQMSSNVGLLAPDALPPPQKLAGIGNLHFAISSHNPETQIWFDQGINLIFDYWDYEANRAFEQAIRTDPNCAICHWGLAQSLGIHNQEVEGYAHDELMKTVALRSHADKRERMYIDELAAEDKNAPPKKPSGSGGDASQAILRQIMHKYPGDLVAKLMLAETIGDGYDDQGKPRKGTQERIALIQEVLKLSPDNSAANHLWIHAVEASPHPEQALQSAARLGELAPGSGHMTHMPGHIFYRTGDYERAQVSFDLSESVEEAYMKAQHVAADDDWNYVHNLMYSIANLMELGQMARASTVSGHLVAARGERAATLYPWSTRDAISRLNVQLPIALRSGDWPRVSAMLEPSQLHLLPPDATLPHLQQLAGALSSFAHGMQHAQANDLAAATQDSADFDAELWRISQQIATEKTASKPAAPASTTPAMATPANPPPANKAQPIDPPLDALLKNLAILSLELRGAVLLDSGQAPEAKALFAQARVQEKDLGYREPPAFIRPVAEQEADLMMAAAQTAEAEAAWKQALVDRPKSGFPLYGLALLSEKSGNAAQTAAAYQNFITAWKSADPSLPQLVHAHGWLAEHPNQAAAASQPDSQSTAQSR
jgi:tetratricopeptide (TPR) repeat protein